MKLRIKGNTIRFRLLKSEVERLAAAGSISDAVNFGPNGGSLRYSLNALPFAGPVRTRFEDSEIVVEIPEDEARHWAESESIGIAAVQSTGNERLSILIEKDLICLDRPIDPDREDAFPNPAEACRDTSNL